MASILSAGFIITSLNVRSEGTAVVRGESGAKYRKKFKFRDKVCFYSSLCRRYSIYPHVPATAECHPAARVVIKPGL